MRLPGTSFKMPPKHGLCQINGEEKCSGVIVVAGNEEKRLQQKKNMILSMGKQILLYSLYRGSLL